MNTEEPRDILITNITMEYGDASHTRDMLKVELFRIFKERGYTNKYGQVENIRIPFDAKFRRFYYAHLTMCDVTTHPMLLEEIRRSRIIFGSEELVFSKAISYRPSRRHLETTRSSSSHISNDQYGYSDPDYYELKQDETRDRIELTRVDQEKKGSTSNSSFNISIARKRPREDNEIQIVDTKNVKDQQELFNTLQQENDELNFKNKMLKQEIEHAEYKLNNLRTRINHVETRERTISNSHEQWKQKELELRDRENALIHKEVELHVNSERKLKLIREAIETERKQLKQKEINIETRIRIEMYSKDIEILQSKLNDELNKLPKDQKE